MRARCRGDYRLRPLSSIHSRRGAARTAAPPSRAAYPVQSIACSVHSCHRALNLWLARAHSARSNSTSSLSRRKKARVTRGWRRLQARSQHSVLIGARVSAARHTRGGIIVKSRSAVLMSLGAYFLLPLHQQAVRHEELSPAQKLAKRWQL